MIAPCRVSEPPPDDAVTSLKMIWLVWALYWALMVESPAVTGATGRSYSVDPPARNKAWSSAMLNPSVAGRLTDQALACPTVTVLSRSMVLAWIRIWAALTELAEAPEPRLA